MSSLNTSRPSQGGGLKPPFRLMAFASGAVVANLYYNQPLLAELRAAFHSETGLMGLIPTCTQLGYGLAMLLLVPLGDFYERRRLTVVMLLASAVALILFSFSTSLAFAAVAALLIGLASGAPQLLIPYAAHLAPPAERGRVVGTVMSGLLLGILLARTFSGFVGAALGWRAVYWIAALGSLLLTWVMSRRLPESQPEFEGGYLALMRSMVRLVLEQPILRESALIGGMLFGAFSAFWATLIFLLEKPPFHYGPQGVGLFGLLGAGGAMAAPWVGRIADRRNPRLTVGLGIGISVFSYLVFLLFQGRLPPLILGVLLMDLGVQSGHIANQTRVFGLVPEARSRLNTVYMFTYFMGGALGSALGTLGWKLGGWTGVCLAALLMLAVAAGVFLASRPR